MVWVGRSSPMIGCTRQRLPELLFEIKIQDQAYSDGGFLSAVKARFREVAGSWCHRR